MIPDHFTHLLQALPPGGPSTQRFGWFVPGRGRSHNVKLGVQYQFATADSTTQRMLNGVFEFRTAEDGQLYFVIKNRHKEVIAQSEMYPDAPSLSQGVNLVKSNRRAARLEDLTVTE